MSADLRLLVVGAFGCVALVLCVAFAAVLFLQGRELDAVRGELRQAVSRAERSDLSLVACDARRTQIEELLGLAADRRKRPSGVGGP